MVDNRDGTFWAMPDNGFGAKANSADFLLRLYRVRPKWETAGGAPARSRWVGTSRCVTPTGASTSPS